MERIEITDRTHLMMLHHWAGLLDAAEHATAAAKRSGVVGMTIMAEMIQAQANEYGAGVKMKNVILAMQNGFDPKREKLILQSSDGFFYLEGEAFDLLEQIESEDIHV